MPKKVELTEDASSFLDTCRCMIEAGGETAPDEEIVEEALRLLQSLLLTHEEWDMAMAKKAGIVQ